MSDENPRGVHVYEPGARFIAAIEVWKGADGRLGVTFHTAGAIKSEDLQAVLSECKPGGVVHQWIEAVGAEL